MEPYLDALYAMHDLLGALNESHWQKWIGEDIYQWRTARSVTHHLSAYGGIGSFNDINFNDPWLGNLFDGIQSVCYFLAKQFPAVCVDQTALQESMGTIGCQLSGWMCFGCGYGVVSNRDIDGFVAYRIIREEILKSVSCCGLRGLVGRVVRKPPSNSSINHKMVLTWVEQSGINVRIENGWWCPCPSCASEDTGVYRWDFVGNPQCNFRPAAHNLPVGRKAPPRLPSIPSQSDIADRLHY